MIESAQCPIRRNPSGISRPKFGLFGMPLPTWRCPKYRHRGFDKVLAHVRNDNCERCRAVYRQLYKECALVSLLMRSRN